MRLVILFLCFCFSSVDAQFISRDFTKSDTIVYVSCVPQDDIFFEDNNYYINLLGLDTPCYYEEIIKPNGNNSIERIRNGLSNVYKLVGNNYCMIEAVLPDWYGHGPTMQIKFKNGYCDLSKESALNRYRDNNSTFTAKFVDVNANSSLHQTISDFDYAEIEGEIKSRIIPVGRRELTTIGYRGVLEIFRFDETIKVNKVMVYSEKGKSKEVIGFEKSQNFRELSKKKYLLVNPISGITQTEIIIKDFQETIVEKVLTRIETTPKDILKCTPVGAQEVFLYPNPSFGRINLKFDGFEPGDYAFNVYNIIGKPVYEVQLRLQDDMRALEIDVSHLKKGTYLYSVSNEKGERIIARRLSVVNY